MGFWIFRKEKADICALRMCHIRGMSPMAGSIQDQGDAILRYLRQKRAFCGAKRMIRYQVSKNTEA